LRSGSECVIVSGVTPVPTWILLAASLVIGLAALVRMAGPAPGGPDDIAGIIRLPGRVTGIIVALFALAALVFHLGLMRRLRSRRHGEGEDELGSEAAQVPPWMRTLRQFLSLLNLLVLAYLLWRGAIPLAGLLSFGQGAGSGTGPTLALPGAIGAPPLATWTFATLALAAGLGALALAVWVTFGERLAEWWEGAAADAPPLPPLAAAVEESLEDLRAEPDARRAIIRCYARFERVAADSGFQRKPWHTPMEFMREALPRLPVPRGTVPTLTGLFELARFSHRALGPTERDRAVDALDEIKAAIEEGRADAARR
jgi:hypothetical protein